MQKIEIQLCYYDNIYDSKRNNYNNIKNNIIKMSKAELCKLIQQRNRSLTAYRKYAINDHENYRQNYISALSYLIKEPNSQPQVYQQISQLLKSADLSLSKSIAAELIPQISKLHTKSNLDEHILFWSKAYDGSLQKQGYPNLKMMLKDVKIKDRDRPLSGLYKEYYQRFSNNYNEKHDERIQFFQDFDDDMVSQSLDNESKLYDIVYLNIMELKMVKNKINSQKLSQEEINQQLNKLQYFVKLKKPAFLSEHQDQEYQRQIHWAREYLINYDENNRKNQNVSINKTFRLSLDQEKIEIVEKNQFQQKRILKNNQNQAPNQLRTSNQGEVQKLHSNNLNDNRRQVFEDSLDLGQSTRKPDRNSIPIEAVISPQAIDSIKQAKQPKYFKSMQQPQKMPKYKPSHKGIFSSYGSPVKRISDDYQRSKLADSSQKSSVKAAYKQEQPLYLYNPNNNTNSNNINNTMNVNNSSNNSNNLMQNVAQEKDEELNLADLVVHKYGGKDNRNTEIQQKPRDFSVTQNYFKKQILSPYNQLASPKQRERQTIMHSKSQTLKQWNRNQNLSPQHSRCKLSEFTSDKKQRKQLVPRSEISFPEDFAINPYLIHFENLNNLFHFRRNCFQRNMILYSSGHLSINCNITKEVNNQIKLQISYKNLTKSPLDLECIYKIPLCYTIQKKSKINKRFTLASTHSHVFSVGIEQFPLQACIINLKYYNQSKSLIKHIFIPLPITIINFIEYLLVSEMEWGREWQDLKSKQRNAKGGGFTLCRNIELDRVGVAQALDWLLRDYFMKVSPVQGYSVQDYGCCCFYSAMNKLKFLMRLSVRVNNIVSIEMVSQRPVSQSQEDFMRYIMNIWMFLLTKL